MAESRRASDSYGKIAIVGVGLIGGSLALALRQVKFKGKLIGVSSERTVEEALRLRIVDEGYSYDTVS